MLDVPQLVEKKNALWGDALVLLLELEYLAGSFLRWARIDGRLESSIEFEGELWLAFPIGNPRRPQSSRSEIPTFEIPVANPDRIFQSVLQNHIIEGKSGRLITVDRDHLDDPTAKVEEWFTVETATSTAKQVTLTCKGIRFNPRRARIPSQTMTRAEYPGLLPSRYRYQ